MIQKTEHLSNDHPIIKIPQPVFLELFACCYAGHEIAIQTNAQQAFYNVLNETKKGWGVATQTWLLTAGLIQILIADIDEIKQIAKQWLEVISTGETVSITEITSKYVRENYLAEDQIYVA